MQKYTGVWLICFLLIGIPSLAANGSAWKHGSYSYEYALSPQDYNPSYYYSTIDWIADAALEILLQSDDRWQWLYNYRYYYFTGTEMIASEETRCEANGTILIGQAIEPKLYFRWNITKDIFSENFMGAFTDEWNRSLDALAHWNYAESAVRLGMLVAYIANAVSFTNYEVGDRTFWAQKTFLDGLINQYTSSYTDSQWFFLWYPYTPVASKVPTDLKALAQSVMWDATYNGYWLNESLAQIEIVSDYYAMVELGNTSLTYQFFTRMEHILNTAIQFSVDTLATLFQQAGAEGGDIDPPSWYAFMSTKSWALFWGGLVGLAIAIVIVTKWKKKRDHLLSIRT